MANPAISQPAASLRNMRETYVNLLLSNGQQATPPLPFTPRASWTPGQGLAPVQKEHGVHWASPVTPGLSDSEIRVAEAAANLVFAGDAEKRKQEAIRTLAEKLEKTEHRNRELEAAVRTEEKRKKEKRRISYGEARRNINFTPRTPRRSTGMEFGPERRRSSRYDKNKLHDSHLYLELEGMKTERAQWLQEREKFGAMMIDIKTNTSRLLQEREAYRREKQTAVEERDAQLQVIARLQEQLMVQRETAKRDIARVSSAMNGSPISGPGNGDKIRDSNFHYPVTTPERDVSPVPIFDNPNAFDDENDENELDSGDKFMINSEHVPAAHSVDEERFDAREFFDRAEELQTELQLVVKENDTVRERNSALQEENAVLQEKFLQLENKCAQLQANQQTEEEAEKSDAEAVGRLQVPTSDKQLPLNFDKLLEEVQILESVSSAMRFETSPSEADRAQRTLSENDIFSVDLGNQMISRSRNHAGSSGDHVEQHAIVSDMEHAGSHTETLRNIADRIVVVRTDLCAKYGKWLEAVANDMSSAGGETLGDSLTGEQSRLLNVPPDCVDTEVIDELVRS